LLSDENSVCLEYQFLFCMPNFPSSSSSCKTDSALGRQTLPPHHYRTTAFDVFPRLLLFHTKQPSLFRIITTTMDDIYFKYPKCGLSNSRQCQDECKEGYRALYDRCRSEHVICRFLGCNKVFRPSTGASSKKNPWTYFMSNHYQCIHEHNYSWRKRKADNDLQSQSHLAVSVRESTNDNNNVEHPRVLLQQLPKQR
jgi:hypothetical protein